MLSSAILCSAMTQLTVLLQRLRKSKSYIRLRRTDCSTFRQAARPVGRFFQQDFALYGCTSNTAEANGDN